MNPQLGNDQNAGALLRAAVTARDQVAAAFRRPNADGSSNVGGLFQQSWPGEDDGLGGGLGVGGLRGALAGMSGRNNGAGGGFFSAVSGGS